MPTRKGGPDSGAGPGSPSGAGVGGQDQPSPGTVPSTSAPTPAGPGRPEGSLVLLEQECRLWANRARFDLISQEYSQNRIVSPKYVHKACHSPYIQNWVQKSPLGFLRFPILAAFSHKELMGPF